MTISYINKIYKYNIKRVLASFQMKFSSLKRVHMQIIQAKFMKYK